MNLPARGIFAKADQEGVSATIAGSVSPSVAPTLSRPAERNAGEQGDGQRLRGTGARHLEEVVLVHRGVDPQMTSRAGSAVGMTLGTRPASIVRTITSAVIGRPRLLESRTRS